MAQKPPAFQMYVKDWMTSPTVLRMSHKERGVYHWLLCAAWSSDEPGTLPFPAKIAARSVGLDPRLVSNLLKKFPSCFVKQGDKYVNEKLVAQWRELSQISDTRRHAAQARWNKPSPGTDASASNLQSPAFASASASAFAFKNIKQGFGFSTGIPRKIQEAARESHVGEGPSDTHNLGGFVMHECSGCHRKFTRSALARHLKAGCTPQGLK
jgi:uncharacterized protein YdaU (DUF1376 family)